MKLIAQSLLMSLALSSFFFTSVQANTHGQNFVQAKKMLTKYYYSLEEPKTFYCNCPLKFSKPTRMYPDLNSCGYKTHSKAKLALRINYEHIMPASWLGKDLKCWQNGGRKNCKNDPKFDVREGDMHNLVPAIAEINAVRLSYRYQQFLVNEPSKYGKCEFYVSDTKPKAVMPADYTRGFIARAMLYMSQTYNIKLSSQQEKLMNIWNNKYDVTKEECDRNLEIKKLQGNDNPFITKKCKAKGL